MEADGLEQIEAGKHFDPGDFYTQARFSRQIQNHHADDTTARSSLVEVSNITASGLKLSAVVKVLK